MYFLRTYTSIIFSFRKHNNTNKNMETLIFHYFHHCAFLKINYFNILNTYINAYIHDISKSIIYETEYENKEP